ncbi:MAG: HupE/UreJ family protein [Verrucomicrobiales bacterium]
MSTRLQLIVLAAVLLGVAMPNLALAHSPGENYVWLNLKQDRIEGRFEIRLQDLEKYLGLELDSSKSVEENARALSPKTYPYILEHFAIELDGTALPIEFTEIDSRDLSEGDFAMYYFTAPLGGKPLPDKLTLRDDILCETSMLHRSLVLLNENARTGKTMGEEHIALIFSAANSVQELDLLQVPSLLEPRQFIWQGILHIWIGIDHILFLFALLLPAVLRREGHRWVPVATFRAALLNVLKIVTLFTIAHSITLALAALDFIRLPGRFVESVIALSIIVVAANNIWPRFSERSWILIVAFGLFHGLGFASVMGDLPFRIVQVVKVVLGFNIGVELGQLAIVAVIFPILYAVLKSAGSDSYQKFLLVGGSSIVSLVALFWLIQRAFNLG